jgi:hypothetical protein
VADDPEALGEEHEEQERGEALRTTDVDARTGHAIRPGLSIFNSVTLSQVASPSSVSRGLH